MRKVILLALLFATMRIYASGSKEMIRHLVKPNENLFRISLVYNSTVRDIVNANPGLRPDFVRSGATIRVPAGTHVRDAAFVEALLSGKIRPVYQDEDVPPATAQTDVKDQEDENPFITPVKKKSIEQMERESALENNVPQKSFSPAAKAASPAPVSSPVKTEATSARTDLVIDPTAQAGASEPSPASIGIAPGGAHGYTSDALQKWSKFTPFTSGTGPVSKGAISSDMALEAPNSYFAEVVRQLDLLVDPLDIKNINIQILLNDGSVQTITTPDEQKKILAQLITGMPVPNRDN